MPKAARCDYCTQTAIDIEITGKTALPRIEKLQNYMICRPCYRGMVQSPQHRKDPGKVKAQFWDKVQTNLKKKQQKKK